jgi:hypothetical protein
MCSLDPIVVTYLGEYRHFESKDNPDKQKYVKRFISDYVPKLLEYFKKPKPSSDCNKEVLAYDQVVDIFTKNLDKFKALYDNHDTDFIAAYKSIQNAINDQLDREKAATEGIDLYDVYSDKHEFKGENNYYIKNDRENAAAAAAAETETAAETEIAAEPYLQYR